MTLSNNAKVIADNLARVRERIARAAEKSGRDADAVRLVAVTKYVGADEAAALLEAGQIDLAESRPQELWSKASDPRLRAGTWHLIGHLQRNKVARTLPLAALVHSVDSERLLTAIDSASMGGREVDVLLEVNCSGDAAKHGFKPDEVDGLVRRLGGWPHVRVRGLMTMAGRDGGDDAAQSDFALLRATRDRLAPNCPDGVHLDELSMGMSGDFEAAIQEGATIVRVGSALFEGVVRR